MSTPKERIVVFEDTMDWIKADTDLAYSVVEAKKNTEIFWERKLQYKLQIIIGN